MIINIIDHRELVHSMAHMLTEGFNLVAFPTDGVSDITNLAYFKSDWEATEYCYEMSNDVDFYKSQPIQSVLDDLDAMKLAGMDTIVNKAIDISGMAELCREQREFQNTNLNTTIMNEKNFDYLKDQIKYTGFGEGLEKELRENLEKQAPEFKISHIAQYGNDTATATLMFRKSEQSDMYFFNSYKVELQKENTKENMEQTFYINKGSNITMKEAYNLMEGRSVNKNLTSKEGTEYNAWVQIDFKDTDNNGNFRLNHFHENYGYDLEAAVSKHPVKELENESYKEDLMNSLKKGNVQSATFIKNGIEIKQFIEANPQFKTVNIYDENMKRITTRQSQDEGQSKGERASQKQDNKKENQAPDDDDSTSKGTRKRKSQSNSM